MNPLHQILADAVGTDAGRPLVTFYDDGTGERVELSAATLDNWVAKTANLLRDEFSVAPGDLIDVRLPPHWQTMVVALACWRVGATLLLDADASGVAPMVSIADVPGLDDALGTDADVVGLSLAPMGRGMPEPRSGVLDYAAEVLSHGDLCSPVEPGPNPALVTTDDTATGYAELVAELRESAAAAGIGPKDRVLLGYDHARSDTAVSREGLVRVLAPLAVGASVVLVRHADRRRLAGLAGSERVTHTLSP